MHPLNTLIESQRRQIRSQSAAPRQRRRSSTEEAAILAQTQREARGFSLAVASAVVCLMFVALAAAALV